MIEQQTANIAFNIMDILPFLITAGSVFGTYIAFGKFIKAWIIKGLISKDDLIDPEKGLLLILKKECINYFDQDMQDLKDIIDKDLQLLKDSVEKDIHINKENSEEKDKEDRKWLNKIQDKIEALQEKVAALGGG